MIRLPLRLCLCLMPLAALLAGCATPPTHPSLLDARLPTLLPARSFAGLEPAPPALSPDGKRLRWFEDGVMLVGAVQGGPAFRLETGQHTPHWAADSRHLVWEEDTGDGNGRVMLLDAGAEGAAPVDATPWPGSRSRLLHAGEKTLLLISDRRERGVFDAWSVDLATMQARLLMKNPGDVVGYLVDDGEQIGGRIRSQDDRHILQVADARGYWKSVYSWSRFDHVQPLRLERGSGRLLLLSNVGRDKTALAELSLRDGSEQLLFIHPDVDPHRAVLDPDGLPVAVWYDPDLPRTHVFDRALDAALRRALPHDVKAWRLQGVDRGSRQAVIRAWSQRGSIDGLFDSAGGKLTLLADRRGDPALDALVTTRPVRFKSSDGRTIPAYLTLPHAQARPLPMLVWVHDGPWQRAYWSPSELHAPPQFLANRGYAVLEVNHRGSRGYGRAHMEAAAGEIGGALLRDIAAGVDWAVQRGIADPRHVAIGGAGFGGYAALQGANLEPGRYACGIDVAGVVDLASALENPPRDWKASLPLWRRYAGDPADPEARARLIEISPLYWAERLRAPLLVVQGAHDVLLMQEHAERMVRALRTQDKPVQYLVFSDEGRQIRQQQNRVALHRAVEDFLAACLGGRSGGPAPF